MGAVIEDSIMIFFKVIVFPDVFLKKLNQNVSITVECVQGFCSQTVIICEILTEDPQSSSTCFS